MIKNGANDKKKLMVWWFVETRKKEQTVTVDECGKKSRNISATFEILKTYLTLFFFYEIMR